MRFPWLLERFSHHFPELAMRLTPILIVLVQTSLFASPLKIFDEANLNGPGIAISETFTIYSGSDIPNNFEDKISSLLVDAGHMVVVSTQADGLGPGKTYIADQEDLIVRALPDELDNAVSFIRVVPWRSTNKKGTAGDLRDEPSVNASWYYRWSRNISEGQVSGEYEYVPMSWGAAGTSAPALADYLAMSQVNHLLGFNESDNCFDQSGQYGDPKLCNVPTAVELYKNLQKVGLRLGSPATREEGAQNTNGWLNQFITECEEASIRIDFVALHWYDWESSPLNNRVVPASQIFRRFKRYLSNAYHRHRKPLWITEFNANRHRSTEIQNEFLELALPYLESIGYVERYAYFQPNGGAGDFFENGQLTSTGEIYRDQLSTPAYSSKEMPSTWNNQDVGSVALAGTTIYSDGVFTVCGSGSGIGGSADEFHYTHTQLPGDGYVIVQVDTVLQRGESKAGLMIRETLDEGSKHASIFLTESGQARFEHRSSTDGSTVATLKGNLSGPYWLKLEREENKITGSYSNDASTWTTLSEQTITFNEDVRVGLAVSSQNDANFCDAIFKNLSVQSNSFPDQSQDFFELEYFKADEGYLKIEFSGLTGKTYTLEISETLEPGSWRSVNSITASSDGQQSLDYNSIGSPDALFGRIRVEN